MKKHFLRLPAFFIFSMSFYCRSQLQVDTTYTPDYLVRNILVKNSSNIFIDNVSYRGSLQSIGFFEFSATYNDIIPKGIILSTGDVMLAMGPNTASGMGSKVYTAGDDDLNSLTDGITFDASVLEFDFSSPTDIISFNYFFASEEYPEYVNKHVNDVFGFFLTSDEIPARENLAVLEPAKIPISVDNINSQKNRQFYIENKKWEGYQVLMGNGDKKTGELSCFMQYDGLTVRLHAGAKVVPGKRYHLKMAIADVGDQVFDSAIFMEAGSFSSTDTTKPTKKIPLAQLIEKNFSAEKKEYSDSTVSVNIYIRFEVDSFNIKGEDSFRKLGKVLAILTEDTSVNVLILGHADSTGTEEKNLTLSLNRAKAVSEYLVSKSIGRHRISYSGMGTSRPVSRTDISLNRRVEFVFKTGRP